MRYNDLIIMSCLYLGDPGGDGRRMEVKEMLCVTVNWIHLDFEQV
jgi:hypothetical protein